MATIEFRGVMLFVCEGGLLKKVVFPDTRRVPPGGKKVGVDKKKFRDRSNAVNHYPGLIHVRGDGSEKHYDLTESTVAFLGGTEQVERRSIEVLPDLSTLLEPQGLAFDDSAHWAASIAMLIPMPSEVRVDTPKKQKFSLANKYANCPLTVEIEWTGEVTIVVTDTAAQSVIRVRSGERAVIHHFDERTPLYSQLTSERDIPSSKNSLTDHDFKWLYALCEPKPGSSKWTHPTLPAPQWKRPVAASTKKKTPVVVSVSTCFPGRIGA